MARWEVGDCGAVAVREREREQISEFCAIWWKGCEGRKACEVIQWGDDSKRWNDARAVQTHGLRER